MSIMAVYDENVEVVIVRDGEKMYVPFCELVEGDVVDDIKNDMFFTVGEDAHLSGDASYPGWLVRSDSGDDWYPEDFGAELVDCGAEMLEDGKRLWLVYKMVNEKIDEDGAGEYGLELDEIDELLASEVFVGKLVELVVEEMQNGGGYASDAMELVFEREFEGMVDAFRNRAAARADRLEDIEWVMHDFVRNGYRGDRKLLEEDNGRFVLEVEGQKLSVDFDLGCDGYVYTVNGQGPFEHSSYEYIGRDILDVVEMEAVKREVVDNVGELIGGAAGKCEGLSKGRAAVGGNEELEMSN